MKQDWWSCDGGGYEGDTGSAPAASESRRPVSIPVSRRGLLLGSVLGAVAWAARGRTALADVAVAPGRPGGNVLVTLFLRGGADGLNIVAPYGEDAYHRRRPNIGLASPKDRGASAASRALDLDGFFGLHPVLAPLHPLYHDGRMAVVQAVGSGDRTHSHFEAMAAMERGQADDRTGSASGWLARHLSSAQGRNTSPLRAVAFSGVMPDLLRGTTDGTALSSLADFRLDLPGAEGSERAKAVRRALAGVYQDGDDAVAEAGRETLAVLQTLNQIDPARYRPAGGAAYPASDLGNGFKQVACLIKGRVGLEVACLDRGGWDSHVAQGGASGWLALQLDDVAKSLAAFATDLGPEMRHVTVVVMTEFGRRLGENSGLGTDHGSASMMLLLGGGVRGGRVFGRWPGLEDRQLEGPGDLKVTTDYRDVLAEVVARRLHNRHLAAVFPDHKPRPLGIVSG